VPMNTSIAVSTNPVPPLPNFSAWLQRGAQLVQNHKQAKWALGDWLLEADNAERVPVWPNQYLKQGLLPPYEWIKAAAAHYGYTYDTLLQFKRVAAAFPPATRVAALSWHHHQAVAAIAEPAVRAEWLQKAKLAGWSSKNLQEKVSLTKWGLSIPEALKMAELAWALGMAADKVQVLIVREFLDKNDETLSEFVFKHRESFE
jgi:hypothetical protein